MRNNIEYYRGKDIASEVLKEKIEELQTKERNFIDNARLNALVELEIEIASIESQLPLPF